MNVTNKTTKTFTISEITESQAQDLLNIAANCPVEQVQQGVITETQRETLNSLRQALLSVGLTRGDTNAG